MCGRGNPMKRIKQIAEAFLSDGCWVLLANGIITLVVMVRSISLMLNGEILLGIGAMLFVTVCSAFLTIFAIETGVIASQWVDENGIPITDPDKYPEL